MEQTGSLYILKVDCKKRGYKQHVFNRRPNRSDSKIAKNPALSKP